jgi:C4-dicarboxylate-specific signal transduction histidine kinase
LRQQMVQQALDKEIERSQLIKLQKIELQKEVEDRTADLKNSLMELKSTQSQLIQSEKMASLGELTAGIAHEIQNPLNFVNNFSELNTELIQEFKIQNSKIKSQKWGRPRFGVVNDIENNRRK